MKIADILNSSGNKVGEIHGDSGESYRPSPWRFVGYAVVALAIVLILISEGFGDDIKGFFINQWESNRGAYYCIFIPVVAAPVISLVVTLIKRKNILFFLALSVAILIVWAFVVAVSQCGVSLATLTEWKAVLFIYAKIYLYGIVLIALLVIGIRAFAHLFFG